MSPRGFGNSASSRAGGSSVTIARTTSRRGDWLLYASRGSVVALNFVSMLVLAALMGLGDFGRFVFLWTAGSTLAAVSSLGGQAYLVRELSARQGNPSRGVSPAEAMRIALVLPFALLLTVGAAAVTALPLLPAVGLQPGAAEEVLVVCAVALALNLFGHSGTPYLVTGSPNAAMIARDGLPQLLLLAAAFVASRLPGPTPLLTLKLFLAFAAMAVPPLAWTGWVRPRRKLWRDGDSCRGTGLKSFWASAITGSLTAQVDVLLGGVFLSGADLGAYQILKRLANLASLPQIVANWSALARVGKAYAGANMPAVQQACRHAAKLTLVPGLLLVGALLATLPLFSRIYNIPLAEATWTVFALILSASLVSVCCGVNFTVASQCHMEHNALRSRLAGVALAVGVILHQAHELTSVTLAAAMLCAAALSNLSLWWLIRRRLKVDTSLYCLLRPDSHGTPSP